MRNEATVERLRGLYCQRVIGQLWFKKVVLVRCPSMPSLPIALGYCVDQEIGTGGAVAD